VAFSESEAQRHHLLGASASYMWGDLRSLRRCVSTKWRGCSKLHSLSSASTVKYRHVWVRWFDAWINRSRMKKTGNRGWINMLSTCEDEKHFHDTGRKANEIVHEQDWMDVDKKAIPVYIWRHLGEIVLGCCDGCWTWLWKIPAGWTPETSSSGDICIAQIVYKPSLLTFIDGSVGQC
jgi:hypothetical protein